MEAGERDGTTGMDPDLTNNIDTFTNPLAVLPRIDPLEIDRDLKGQPWPDLDSEEEEELLTVGPIFSGRGPAGASVIVTLVGEGGVPIAVATSIVAENGTWLMTMPDVALPAQPLNAIVTVLPSPVRVVEETGEQVFYGPAADTPITFERRVVTLNVSEAESYEVLQSLIAATENPIPRVSANGLVNFDQVVGTQINN